jgi:uncharacterized damage-inducible protein DinB
VRTLDLGWLEDFGAAYQGPGEVNRFCGMMDLNRRMFLAALRQIPPHRLWEGFGGGGNSAGALGLHVAASEAMWIQEAIFGRPYPRDRQAEFLPKPHLTLADVEGVLRETREVHLELLATLPEAELASQRASPRGGSYPVAWYLWHTIQHESYHLGQVALYAKVWG